MNNVTEYTRQTFPYSGILKDLTEKVTEEAMSPVQAYVEFLNVRDAVGLGPYFDYGSTSITTGGHTRVQHPTQTMQEVIEANTRTAREMVTVLHKQGSLLGREVILPVDFGKTSWRQSDYMTYWSLTIAGHDIRELRSKPMGLSTFELELRHILHANGVDLDTMNASGLLREIRQPHYKVFASAYAQMAKRLDVSQLPAHRLISLVDPDISLGCWAEKLLAQELNIPTQRVAPVQPATIEEAVPLPTLRKDMQIITALGGTVCVALQGSILTLIGEPDQGVET